LERNTTELPVRAADGDADKTSWHDIRKQNQYFIPLSVGMASHTEYRFIESNESGRAGVEKINGLKKLCSKVAHE
jgi:hypothetical protein